MPAPAHVGEGYSLREVRVGIESGRRNDLVVVLTAFQQLATVRSPPFDGFQAQPGGIAITPDGLYAYDPGSMLYLMDRRIIVGMLPHVLKVSPRGYDRFVTNAISEHDLADRRSDEHHDPGHKSSRASILWGWCLFGDSRRAYSAEAVLERAARTTSGLAFARAVATSVTLSSSSKAGMTEGSKPQVRLSSRERRCPMANRSIGSADKFSELVVA